MLTNLIVLSLPISLTVIKQFELAYMIFKGYFIAFGIHTCMTNTIIFYVLLYKSQLCYKENSVQFKHENY